MARSRYLVPITPGQRPEPLAMHAPTDVGLGRQVSGEAEGKMRRSRGAQMSASPGVCHSIDNSSHPTVTSAVAVHQINLLSASLMAISCKRTTPTREKERKRMEEWERARVVDWV